MTVLKCTCPQTLLYILGVAALYWGSRPNDTPRQVIDAIKAGAVKAPTILTKEKGEISTSDSVLLCYVNGIQTCTPRVDCTVSLRTTHSFLDCLYIHLLFGFEGK